VLFGLERRGWNVVQEGVFDRSSSIIVGDLNGYTICGDGQVMGNRGLVRVKHQWIGGSKVRKGWVVKVVLGAGLLG
jgi:hypothetical protein